MAKKKLTPLDKDLKTLAIQWANYQVLEGEEDVLITKQNSIARKLTRIDKQKIVIQKRVKPLMKSVMRKAKNL